MGLESLFGQVAGAIMNHSSPNTPGPSYDANGILGQLSGLFGQHAQQSGEQFQPQPYETYANSGDYGGMQSSNQDPFGDPGLQGGAAEQASYGNQAYGNVQSSNQDPFGDPGLQGGSAENPLSSNQDPYGDPGLQR